MRRLLLAMLIATVNAPAWADWVRYQSSDSGTIHYYDPSTVRKSGNLVRVWGMQSYSIEIAGAWSRRAYQEYDCKEIRSRLLQVEAFSGRMGSGDMLGPATGVDRWEFVAPGTVSDALLQIVCK